MPAPYPGQQWKHGWVPLTPTAARQKNHGSKPGPASKISKMMDDAIRAKSNARRFKPPEPLNFLPPEIPVNPTPTADVAVKNDIAAATAMQHAGDYGQALRLLNRAAKNAKDPKVKKSILDRRDTLARRISGNQRD